MNISKFLYKSFIALFLVSLFLVSCETDDILPAVELTVDAVNLGENSQSVVLTATLNSSATENITIPVTFTGTASASDYTSTSSSISISSGRNTGTLTISSIQDQEIEGPETIIINIENTSGFLVLGMNEITISLQDDDSDTDNDGVLDANDNCPNTPGDVNNNGCPFLGFLINEVLYDPASGSAGDANGDGTRDANEDEFIEFFNSGNQLDISGYTIEDASRLRHTFPEGSIVPRNGVLIVFGGGTPTGSFDGAVVQTASEGLLNMSNSGDFMTIKDTSGNVILTFDVEPLSNNPDESYTRNPDLTGSFEQHSRIDATNRALFSPGTKLDGSSF
ncbi:lamin tail domain-containing protein [Polaribacter litorisediminis]|uniref:lamin tail domain-containing protein n=1 Tax=Polaribacter litorisediminis TaxID=1908341 RepID=UPI001CBCEECE|nr:lamin tail domain-containing protein [Polaribacter litorisediminis]UAM97917.1 lamin tail domain-containing protein [Polaribacter litorisediminis]